MNLVKIRKSNDRGGANHGWLDTKHTFSFSDYYDANHMGFRSLRVINEDFIGPDSGFGMHPHKDMEIISYVVSGVLTHKDSMGNEANLSAGHFQAMSAGKGIVHSEYNKSKIDNVHLLQIWIMPEVKGLEPSYQELSPKLEKGISLIASQNGEVESMKINQNAKLYFADFGPGSLYQYNLPASKAAWLQLVSGKLEFNSGSSEYQIGAGDGVAFEGEVPEIRVVEEAKFLLFELR